MFFIKGHAGHSKKVANVVVVTMKRIFTILVLLMGACGTGVAQKVSNKGTEFWAGFGHTAEMETTAWLDTPRVAFSFSAEQAANVVLTINGTSYRREYVVPANSVVRSENMPQGFRDIPASAVDAQLYSRPFPWPGGTNSEGIFKNKGIHIQSDVPIVVHEIEYAPFSAAATMLIPVESWGYSYKVLTHDQKVTEFENLGRFGWVFVVAHYDDTRIQIVPTNATRSGLPANAPINVTLQKGEIYQIQANVPPNNLRGTNDFIGTTIRSVANGSGVCYPVGTFVGSSGAYVHCGSFSGGWPSEDMSIQQIFPVEAWGRRYLATPASRSNDPLTHNSNFFRVMPKIPGTVVKRNGVQLSNLTKGYYEFETNTADYIEADEPVQVVQIFPTQGTCGNQGEGDPEMIFISPIEQGIKKVAFQRLAFPGFENKGLVINWNLLTLNIPTEGLLSLTIDGIKNNFSHSYPNPNLPGYSVVVRLWNTRSNTDARAPTTCVVESDSAFNAITYGVSPALSYAFNVGTYIDNLSGLPFIKNEYNTSDTASLFTCAKTPVELSVLIRYQPSKILWQLSKLADTLSPATDVTVNSPVADGQVLVDGVPYYRYNLPGSYTFNRPGIYTIPVFATAATVEHCDNTEQIPYQIEVRDTMLTDFSLLYENCKASELVNFTGREKFTDSSLVQRWEWNFTNGSQTGTATGREVTYNFNAGTNSARLVAVDLYGCIADTAKTFVLASKPATPVFAVTSIVNCANSQVRFDETAPESGVQTWYWDFGDGKTETSTNGGFKVTNTYGAYDTLTVRHMVKFSENCISDTATQTVIIYANPAAAISHSSNCLPTNDVVQFTSNATVADQQTIKTYGWNFGDAAATPANPNTSVLANPSHSYGAGSYQVLLKLVSEKGCVTDSVYQVELQPRPKINYQSILPAVCLNAAVPISVATATITNGITGTGYYKGPGVDNSGSFTPTVAKIGTHNIWYIFTSSEGCTDSAVSSIKVNAVPVAAFGAPANVCAGLPITLTNQSTIDNTADAATAIQKWVWDFGDGNGEVTYTNGQPFNKQFTANNTISLKVVSNEGCISEPYSQTLTQRELPVVSFDLPEVICMPGGEALFTNTSPGQAALSYKWDFGNGTNATVMQPTAIYAQANNYTVQLIGTDAFGCTDTATKALLNVLFNNRPVASIDISNNKPCENSVVNFGATSNNNNIVAWQWQFGDGTTATSQNPEKTYSKFGSYVVSLSVTNDKGCASLPAIIETKTVEVGINPVINAGADIVAEEGSLVTLKATAENASQLRFNWTPAGLLSNANVLNPTYRATAEQIFVLTATNAEGICTSTSQVTVRILRPVSVPNAFSPNGDGINDVWVIKNLSDYPQSTVEVFDRYGQIAYRTTGYSKPWDGTKAGKPLPVGVYYYIIRVKEGEAPLTGSLTILK
jgi:gliding motility-associated-like protein